jgi:predicted amidophosphoribosyltransferase
MHLSSKLVTSCLHLLWPARCAGCDALLGSDDAIFCGGCAQATVPLGSACAACALPRLGPEAGGGRCPGCARLELAFSRAFAAFEYGGPLADAIVRMKHGDRPELARRLGRLLAATLARAIGDGRAEGRAGGRGDGRADAIVPVPLHARKLRRRGFNQALELALAALRDVARTPTLALALPQGMPRLERRALRRTRPTRPLGHAGPAARLSEVAGAFAVAPPLAGRVRRRRVLLVDDVFTTGATFSECADALLGAGAASVHALALARAV